MPNGFFLSQAQPLDYRATIAGAGAPIAGLMGGVQQGMEMAGQLEEMRASRQKREAEQQQTALQAGQQEQIQALALQAAQGDPAAMQQMAALDPKMALQMQKLSGLQQEQALAVGEAEREAAGALGSLLRSGDKGVVRATYERAVSRIRKEGDSETEVGLPTREEAAEMSDRDLYNIVNQVGSQLEAYGLGPQPERAPLVQVGAAAAPAYKVPSGYMMKDPNRPELGVKAIPGTELEKKVKVGKFTEGQTTSARFAYNMAGATEAIDALEAAGTTGEGFLTAVKRGAGVAGRYTMSPEEQQYIQAQDDWIAAKLRKESGAAIPPEELEAQRKIYFPMPGDSPSVIKQKAKSRGRAQKGMIVTSGGAYKTLFEDTTPEERAAPAGQADLAGMSDEELLKLYGGQ